MVQQLDITVMCRSVQSIITNHPGSVFDALDAMQVGGPTPHQQQPPETILSGVSAADAKRR